MVTLLAGTHCSAGESPQAGSREEERELRYRERLAGMELPALEERRRLGDITTYRFQKRFHNTVIDYFFRIRNAGSPRGHGTKLSKNKFQKK